ncbi:DUF6166 domain-containing protein [Halorubrum sp. AD140]|uniref:DUF6166 domain-containing protein n=1 Tax=Halorubrum sp. AD140 TaxID=3050073 RepID=UPI002ACCCED8|nr:DUF6166 domain-containing protein [Halorubrum sp. AD140]MDZ5810367.1 DUF6166 domain-containing protein [Halorubrum sp. AD140]
MSQGVDPQGSSGEDTPPQPDETEETVYRAHRDPTAPVGNQIEVAVDGEPMDYRYDLLSASPSGFEWGYGGSGPAQLSVALLAHALNDEVAVTYYQQFKREVVSQLPERGWELTADDVRRWHAEVTGNAR